MTNTDFIQNKKKNLTNIKNYKCKVSKSGRLKREKKLETKKKCLKEIKLIYKITEKKGKRLMF